MSDKANHSVVMKERSYRQLQRVRQANAREQRRLETRLNSTNGLTAVHRSSITEVSREQKRVLKELTSITVGLTPRSHPSRVLPPRRSTSQNSGASGPANPGYKSDQMKERDSIEMSTETEQNHNEQRTEPQPAQ